MYGQGTLSGISKQIPHKIAYLYIERYDLKLSWNFKSFNN